MIDKTDMLPVSDEDLKNKELMACCVCSYYVSGGGECCRVPAIDCPVHEDMDYWKARPIK